MVPFLVWGLIKAYTSDKTYADFFTHYYKLGYWYLIVLYEFIIFQTIIDVLGIKFKFLRNGIIEALLFCIFYFALTRLSYLGATNIGVVSDFWQFVDYLPYFYLGSFIRRYGLTSKINSRAIYGIILAVAVILYALWNAGISNMYLTIALRTSIVIGIFLVFMNINSLQTTIIGKQLGFIGRNTLIIYMFQYYLFGMIDFSDILPYLYNTNNIMLIVIITTITSILISWVCIGVGQILMQCPVFCNLLLGKLPNIKLLTRK